MEELLKHICPLDLCRQHDFRILSGYVFFPGCFQERKDCFGIRYGCDVHSDMYVADQLYA